MRNLYADKPDRPLELKPAVVEDWSIPPEARGVSVYRVWWATERKHAQHEDDGLVRVWLDSGLSAA